MVTRVDIKPDHDQVRAMRTDEDTRAELRRVGYQISKAAALGDVPRRTGRGANSIRAYPSTDDPTAYDVSWSIKYYYMIFHEVGWSPVDGGPRKPGRHFLRRAFETYSHM